MKLGDADKRRLADLAKQCAEVCASRLAKVSKMKWAVDTIVIDEGSTDAWEKFFGAVPGDHYGHFFTMPGGGTLCVYGAKTGLLVTNGFTAAYAAVVDALQRREATALAEVSNILVNNIAGTLGDLVPQDRPVSPPESKVDTRSELLVRALKSMNGKEIGLCCFLKLKSPDGICDCDLVVLLETGCIDVLCRGLAALSPKA